MKTERKIDLYKLHKADYVASKKPVFLSIKRATYLAVDGKGAPGSEAFTQRIGALYSAAFTVKMTRKFAGQQDYSVCKLEAQWWGDDGGGDFARLPKEQWRWKFLIRTPKSIRDRELKKAVAVLLERGKTATVKEVKLESFVEGKCVQMLHVGPYEREDETLAVMRAYAQKTGWKFHGRHHEIYLSDPRRVAAERLRTILRQPVAKV